MTANADCTENGPDVPIESSGEVPLKTVPGRRFFAQSERLRLAVLERENPELRMKADLLGNVAAFFDGPEIARPSRQRKGIDRGT